MIEELQLWLRDIRYLKLVPKRYPATKGQSDDYWKAVARDYGNFRKRVDCSGYHWYVVEYKDGRKELAYFRVWRLISPKEGRLCRGIIPRYWPIHKYEHVKHIRLAF